MNPYDFIPLGEPSEQGPRPGHDVLPARGGVIVAKLETLGPFLIADQSFQGTLRPLKNGGIIPGSSLKGAVRNLAEIVGGGCLSISSALYKRGHYSYGRHADEPGGFAPCSSADRLCITCRMFGTLLGGEAWRGMIALGEACRQNEEPPKFLRDLHITVGTPKPEHSSFYTRDRKIRGRKGYYHHDQGREALISSPPARQAANGARQTVQVMALEPGQRYRVTLRHMGLDDGAYALLLYALFLEPGLAHKLGWGKPFGLGSVRITPERIERTDLRARYLKGRGEGSTVHEDRQRCEEHIAQITDELRARTDPTLQALRKLLAYPGLGDAVKQWRYPSWQEFKDQPQATLEEFNRDCQREVLDPRDF